MRQSSKYWPYRNGEAVLNGSPLPKDAVCWYWRKDKRSYHDKIGMCIDDGKPSWVHLYNDGECWFVCDHHRTIIHDELKECQAILPRIVNLQVEVE